MIRKQIDNSIGFIKGKKRTTMFAIILVVICIIGAALGQIVLKSGMGQIGEINSMRQLFNIGTLVRIFTNVRILAGLFCYGIAAILWLGAMSTLNISFIYPLLSLSYVITALIALIFLKENITLSHWIGIIMVVGGCLLIVRANQ
jgi:drug/metabolite transporter (DMT)-like permease